MNIRLIESAGTEGVHLLDDMRKIIDKFGPANMFSFHRRYFDYESFKVFEWETFLNISFAFAAVLITVILFTASFTITFFIVLCVALVDVFLFGLLAVWGVTLNSVTIQNLVIAIGLSVDYNAHIGKAYLTIDPPNFDDHSGVRMTNFMKRKYKARGAIGQIG